MSHRFMAITSAAITLIVLHMHCLAAQPATPPASLVSLRNQATELKKGDQRKRLDVLKELIKLEPDHAMWQVELGDTYYELGWYDDGVDAYVDFAKRFPKDKLYRDACFAIANCLKMAGRLKEADKYLLTLPKDDPEWTIRTCVWRAELVWQNTKPETGDPVFAARKMLTDVIASYPTDPAVWLARTSLAFTYLLTAPQYGNPARAREEFQAMIRDNPGHKAIGGWKDMVAHTYCRENDYDSALRQWREILDDPSALGYHAQVLSEMASHYDSIGQRDEAIRLWKTVLDLYPDAYSAKTAREALGVSGKPDWERVEDAIRTHTLSEGIPGIRYAFSGTAIYPLAGELTSINLEYAGKPLVNARVIATLTVLKPSTKPNSSFEPTEDRQDITFAWTVGGAYTADLNALGPGAYDVRLCITPATQEADIKPSRICWVISPAKCPRISLPELKRLSGLKSVVLVDVRQHPDEYIKGAQLIPAPKLAEYKDTWPAGKTIVLYGSSYKDHDEADAARTLAKLGVHAVAVLGGFDALKAAGWPTATD